MLPAKICGLSTTHLTMQDVKQTVQRSTITHFHEPSLLVLLNLNIYL